MDEETKLAIHSLQTAIGELGKEIKNRMIVIGEREYLVSANDPTARNYEIKYDGELITDVTKIVRYKK